MNIFPFPLPRWKVALSLLGLLLLLSVAAVPALAQGSAVWTGDYYNNGFLGGTPAFSRQDANIAFNWGAGAPADGLDVNNFSVRWGTDAYFDAGTYRFYILADDNVRLWVDFPFQPQIDTFNTAAVGQIVTADITLDAGFHHVQVDYREVTGDAYVFVSWANLATNPVGPNFPVPVTPPVIGGIWTAQYYPNAGLSGAPSVIVSEGTPSHNWGAGSPSVNIPADNFSARWTSVQVLNAGVYQITARADDGVRVYVDGVLYINEWHTATGQTYTASVNLAAGQHIFQVEYFEAGGMAFLEFNLIAPGVVVTSPVVYSPAGATTGTVTTALRLNVRSEPSTSSAILTKINRNETYPVVGRNADGSWWQINVNGVLGWVYWRFFTVNNPQVVAVVTPTVSPSLNQPPPTGVVANPIATVNIRSGPSTAAAILGQIARGNPVDVVGRNATNTWWQVNFSNITGWVSARFAPLQSDTVVANIPITG